MRQVYLFAYAISTKYQICMYWLNSSMFYLCTNVLNMFCHFYTFVKVSKGTKIKNRYNQVSHLTQDTNGKVTNSQLETTNESPEVSLFTAGDHKAYIHRRAQRHSKRKTEKNINYPQKKYEGHFLCS